MPLEFVVNTLDDATHVELDLEMLNLKLTHLFRSFQFSSYLIAHDSSWQLLRGQMDA
jgi:hypothetical protein